MISNKGGFSKMNNVSITGRLVRNAIVNGSGDKKAMKFTIAAPSGYDAKNKKERTEFAPCVYFNPSEKLQELLLREGKGKLVEVQGNIATSSYEKDGNRIWATEVRVDPRGFQFLADGKKNGVESADGLTPSPN